MEIICRREYVLVFDRILYASRMHQRYLKVVTSTVIALAGRRQELLCGRGGQTTLHLIGC